MAKIESYDMESIMSFGKYEYLLLREVLIRDPSYVEWCMINCDFFYISNETMRRIKKEFPTFQLSDKAEYCRLEKLDAKNTSFYYSLNGDPRWPDLDE